MGGLRKAIPKTFAVFMIGALAISGIPGLSGFFSKDEILAAAFASGNYGIWILALVGAGMTAFYMFRLIFLTFYGSERVDPETKRHLHESPNVMILPLAVLAGLSIIGGYIGLPHVLGGGQWFGSFLASSTGAHEVHLAAGTEILLMLVSTAVALAGIFGAHYIYVKNEGRPAERLAERFKAIYHLVSHKYFVDEFYNGVVVGGVLEFGRLCARFDEHVVDGFVNGAAWLTRAVSTLSIGFDTYVVDGAVNGIGAAHKLFSAGLKRLQTGYVYNYALAIVLGIVVIISLVVTVF
jgi:NADH-quinone oxidoreductase subunit L